MSPTVDFLVVGSVTTPPTISTMSPFNIEIQMDALLFVGNIDLPKNRTQKETAKHKNLFCFKNTNPAIEMTADAPMKTKGS